MRNVKLCLLIVLYSIWTFNLVSSNQEICDKQDKPLNKTNETEKTSKPNLISRFNPYLEDRPKENVLKNFNFDYFDPNRIKSKDDFFAMDSDEIGVPMVRPPKPTWQMDNAPYGPQVLPDVVMAPEEPLRRKLIPEALGDDEKQMGRFLVEDTRRIIHVMQPNGEYKTYRPLPPTPDFSYRHPSGISHPYHEPTSYRYQPRPGPYEYANPQRNYINKEFGHPAYHSPVPQLSPSLTAPPMYPAVPHLPIYKTPPSHHLLPPSPSSYGVTPESGEAINLDKLATSMTSSAKANVQKDATKPDSPYRVQLDLGDELDKVKAEATADIRVIPQGNHQEIMHPALQVPIPSPHPAIHPTDDEKAAQKPDEPSSGILEHLGDLLEEQGPQQVTSMVGDETAGVSKSEKPDDPTSDILKQLGDLLKGEVTSTVGDKTTGTSNPEKSDDPNAVIMKQLEDLLKQDTLGGAETGNAELKKSDEPTDGILKQLEDLLRDEVLPQNASLVGSDVADSKGTLNDDISPENVISQALNAPGKNSGKDYSEIINAIMATDDIGDLVNNPLITADALKEIAQLLSIQQGNQDSIDPILASEQEDTKLRAKENAHSKTSSLDSLKDNYTEVLSAIIETDRVEDLANNPNITTDVLKEIADILETEQGSLVTEGNALNLSQLVNTPLSPKETKQFDQLAQGGSIGLFPIGIETESGEVLPMSSFNNSSLACDRKGSSDTTKAPKKSPRRRSKTLRREDDGKELYFLGSTNRIIRIPENLLEKPLLMISNENVLAAKLLNGTLERIMTATAKNL